MGVCPFDGRIRGVRPRFVQADELWTFVHTKERHMRPRSPNEWGDAYVWMAIDSDTKMVLSYLFMSPDPKIPSLAHLTNPQKWNKYPYALNNPLVYFDPDGVEETSFKESKGYR